MMLTMLTIRMNVKTEQKNMHTHTHIEKEHDREMELRKSLTGCFFVKSFLCLPSIYINVQNFFFFSKKLRENNCIQHLDFSSMHNNMNHSKRKLNKLERRIRKIKQKLFMNTCFLRKRRISRVKMFRKI